jgi:hypothetical protein
MQKNSDAPDTRRFEFEWDSFAFKNETYWEYHYDGPGGKMTFTKREPKPDYAHRCFVLTRAARQFFYQTRFDPAAKAPDDNAARKLIRAVVSRNPRRWASPEKQIVIPGYANLREFSSARGQLLKDECGGAWRSYVLRSHWRMVFPISREHQAKTAASLRSALERNIPPIIHLVKFPALTINHSMLVFSVKQTDAGWDFQAADPNTTEKPLTLSFNNSTNTFTLPPNHYWSGGELDIIEIYRSWVM